MIKINKTLYIYLFILFFVGYRMNLFIPLIVVIFHEATHMYVSKIFNIKKYNLQVQPLGTVLKIEELDEIAPLEDLILSVSGPLINLIMALFFYILYRKVPNVYIWKFFYSNLVIGLFNMIPAFPLDGARILRDLLNFKIIYKKANEIVIKLSIIIGMLFLCLYFNIFLSHNYSLQGIILGIIGIFIIVYSLKEQERVVYIIMSDIIKKHYKIIQKGYMENKYFSVIWEKDLLFALSIIEKNKYNVFSILNDNLDIVYEMSEGELVQALKELGNITLKEYVNKRII